MLNTAKDTEQEQQELHRKLNLETAPMPWKELLRHFAAGIVIVVDNELDLIQVAASIASDDKVAVKKWMMANQLMKVSDVQAQAWIEQEAILWTTVVKPFVLVQEKKSL